MWAAPVLHHLHWKVHLVAWSLPLLLIVVAWLLAFVAVGRGPGQRLERSLFSFGHAAIGLVGVMVLMRVLTWIDTSWGDGPQQWLVSALPTWVALPSSPETYAHPYDTLVVVSLVSAAVVFFVTPVASILDPPRADRPPRINAPLPGGTAASVVLGVCAIALPFLFRAAYAEDVDTPVLLDVVGVAPVLAVAIALRLQARIPAAEAPAEELPAPVPAPEGPDIEGSWAAAGLVEVGSPALVEWRAEAPVSTEPTARAAAAWEAAEGPGPPPASLDTLLGRVGEPGKAWLVGDLPTDTEAVLFAALVADAVATQGLRVLVVVPQPAAHAARLQRALERARTWEPGYIAVGAASLRECIARHRLPAALYVTADDLSEQLIRLVGWEGRSWAAGLGLAIVHRPDAGSPIEVTHTTFTFRRWHLATAALCLPSVVATGSDTAAVLSHLERLFPGREPRRCPLGLRARGAVRVLRAQTDTDHTADPWVARAARALAPDDAVVLDPDGRWGAHPLQDHGVEVSREIAFPGHATVADLDGSVVSEVYRAAAHHAPHTDVHWSLWHVRPSPSARFLMVPGRLAHLHARKELPARRPVVGDRNRFLRTAHTLAAVHEGQPDELSLRRAFGDDVVDYVLRECEPTGDFVAWVEGDEVVRSPVIRPPSGQTWQDPYRATVTTSTITVVDERSGQALESVDARVAATRYYPKRVFAVGTRRYRVPLHAIDDKRSKLRVEPAAPTDRLTRPLFRFDLQVRHLTVDRVTRREGNLTVTTCTVEALVREEVLAAWVPGRDQEERFDPVEASYDSEVRLVFPERASDGPGLFHLAATLDDLLPLHLCLDDEDAEVVPVHPGLLPGYGAGLAIIDRHIGGMGLARALDEGTVMALLSWSRALLFECACMDGCALCTPERVLRSRAAKQEVLHMLPK